MILEKQKEAMIHQDGEATESIGMSLDLDSAQVLMQMLSKNLYSDSIGSTIRECASNALDSHRRAGVDKPIVVALKATKDGAFEFSVEDFGIGLDADDVKNIISKYGKSTKRNSSTELGMMGLGFKAPLAYTSSFYFVARKNGMERKYMMYEGEDVNTIDLLYETPTDQPNGVKVIVPVSWRDKYDFKNKIREQLAYFESVYFDVEDINNNFTIVRHQYFQFSELAKDNNLHICLDNVYYPMDFNKLGIERIGLPVALRFSLTDGIFPTPNRESIRYTQEAKVVILKRLQEAADYFIQKYNETITDTEDVRQIVNYFSTDRREIKFGTSSWDVHPLSKFATIKIAEPKFKGTSLIEPSRIAKIQEYILGEYEAKFVVTKSAMRDAKHYYQITSVKRMADKVYVYEGERIPGLKKDYIKSLHGGKWEEEHVFRKVKSFKLRPKPGGMVQAYDNYYNILNLKSYPKAQWRQLIQEFQLIVKSLVSTFIDLDTLEVPQTFVDSRKKQRISAGKASATPGVRRIKLKGEMVCKQAEGLERWVDGKQCKWVSKIYDMATFHKNKFILVYGKQEDAEKMDQWFKATRNHNVELAILSDRELKLVNGIELHNLMPFSKFMEGKNKPFERIATGCLIDQLRDDYRAVFSNNVHLQKISTDLYQKTEALNLYHKKNFRDIISDNVRNAIAEQALDIKAVDAEIYSTYKEVKSICEKFVFLNTILDKMGHYDSDSNRKLVQAITDLFKYHKHRIDWKNYNIRLNEDLPLEETLTTETVEELIQQD
jgi:hypothetical protein